MFAGLTYLAMYSEKMVGFDRFIDFFDFFGNKNIPELKDTVVNKTCPVLGQNAIFSPLTPSQPSTQSSTHESGRTDLDLLYKHACIYITSQITFACKEESREKDKAQNHLCLQTRFNVYTQILKAGYQ